VLKNGHFNVLILFVFGRLTTFKRRSKNLEAYVDPGGVLSYKSYIGMSGVWFLSLFSLKFGIDFDHFDLK